jgi:hypothetical protein
MKKCFAYVGCLRECESQIFRQVNYTSPVNVGMVIGSEEGELLWPSSSTRQEAIRSHALQGYDPELETRLVAVPPIP